MGAPSVNLKSKSPSSPQLELLISEEAIQQKISEISEQLNTQYRGRELTIIMIMKGSICLVADLIRRLQVPFTLEFVQGSSYGSRGTTRGELTVWGIDALALESKDVLLIDDIFDSGHTLQEVAMQLKKKRPNTLRSLVLLSKGKQTVQGFAPDYILFHIADEFVVGYGLDYQEHYRGLPGVYVFKEEGSR